MDVAYDGEIGLDLGLSEDYDLLILDLMLPGLDGITICKKIREANNHVPVLILTAKAQIRDKVEGLDNGADDYLTKPFSFDELLARVRALTRRPKNTLGSVLKSSGITLDTTAFIVKKDNKLISLSNKEFTLLQYLMRNSGKIISKEEITNHVWDYDANILPNTIEVYIRNLRKKNIPIQTVRGFGYKI